MVWDRVAASGNCWICFAGQIGARRDALHAPAMVGSPDLARTFRSEPKSRAQLDRLTEPDVAIFSAGDVADDTHLAAIGMATLNGMQAAREAGAQGVLCCRFVDAEGREGRPRTA